jgi:hypothetical protein
MTASSSGETSVVAILDREAGSTGRIVEVGTTAGVTGVQAAAKNTNKKQIKDP